MTKGAHWAVWFGRVVIAVFLATAAGSAGLPFAGVIFGLVVVSHLLGRLEQQIDMLEKKQPDREDEP